MDGEMNGHSCNESPRACGQRLHTTAGDHISEHTSSLWCIGASIRDLESNGDHICSSMCPSPPESDGLRMLANC
jgi:hypothetical protein